MNGLYVSFMLKLWRYVVKEQPMEDEDEDMRFCVISME